jgi:hypothetical protein
VIRDWFDAKTAVAIVAGGSVPAIVDRLGIATKRD